MLQKINSMMEFLIKKESDAFSQTPLLLSINQSPGQRDDGEPVVALVANEYHFR